MTSCSKINWLNASLTPFIFNSYSWRHWFANSSKSGPYSYWFIVSKFVFSLDIEAEGLQLSKMNLSGMMPNFYKAKAWALVLGNPCTIQLFPFYSHSSTCFFTISMTTSSSTKVNNRMIRTYITLVRIHECAKNKHTIVISFLGFVDLASQVRFLALFFLH